MAPPSAEVLSNAIVELARMTKLTKGAKHGEICASIAGTRLKWKIQVPDEDDRYIPTPS